MANRIDEIDANTDWSSPLGFFIRIDVKRDGKWFDYWITAEQARVFAELLSREADHTDEMNAAADEPGDIPAR